MKLRVTLNFDTKGLTGYDGVSPKHVEGVLSNLGQFFQRLKVMALKRKTEIMADRLGMDPALRTGLLRHTDEEIALADQIFHDYQVEGVMDSGDAFVFTHSEPGYKEALQHFGPVPDSKLPNGSTFVVLLPGQRLRIQDAYNAHQILVVQQDWKTFRYLKSINHHPDTELHPVARIGSHLESYLHYLNEDPARPRWVKDYTTVLGQHADRRPFKGNFANVHPA